MVKTITQRLFLLLSAIGSSNAWVAERQAEPGAQPPAPQQAEVTSKRVSREELEALNAKLREAMTLYYDGAFRLALPILNEIAQRIDTMDVLYWLGHAAYMSGEPDLAIAEFKTLLARNPNQPYVRLELAMAYLQKRDTASAKSEVQKLIEAKPPPAVQRQAERLASYIQRSEKRLFASVRATIGPQFDTNVTAGPSDDTVNVLGDGILRAEKQREGWLINNNFNFDLLYDFSDRDGWFWRNSLYFLHNEYLDSDDKDFNYTYTSPRTGLEYYGPQVRARLPFGMVDTRFANESLSRSFFLNPSLEYSLTKRLELTLGYRYEDEEFIGRVRDAQSNLTHSSIFGPRYRFELGNTVHIASLLWGYSARDAEAERFSYNEWSVGPSYFLRFETGTEAYVSASFLDRDYDAPAFVFTRLPDRADERYAVTVALSQTLYKNYFVSASFSYIQNDSNVSLFEYDKILAGISIGINFNF